MSAPLLYAMVGALIFSVGSVALVLEPHLVRKVVAFNLMGSGAFLALVGGGQRDGPPDPVPQAMVLTGIVVSVAATALSLALARRLLERTGEMRVPPEEPGDG